MPEEYYDQHFPTLKRLGYSRTSEPDCYNCIAYAAGDTRRNWWPGEYPPRSRDYWPPGIPNETTLNAFTRAFATVGYTPCRTGELEPGFEKVAIYAQGDEVRHAARQQASGAWRSKLGQDEDIEHTWAGLEGPFYGTVVAFLKRPTVGEQAQVGLLRRLLRTVAEFFHRPRTFS
jgi:hypothetical protein